MRPPLDVLKSLARLESNADFQLLLDWLREERDVVIEQLTVNCNPVLVHQQQGRLSCLTDIHRSATTAHAVLARIS